MADMNRRILTAAFMASLIVAGCAKDMDAGIYDDENRYLTAWLKQDHKDIGVDISRNPETGLPDTLGRGVYLLSETIGSGRTATSGAYVRVSFTERQLSGTINSSSEASIAKQLGTFDRTYWYGPHTICLVTGSSTAGFVDSIIGMKEGGSRTVLVPQWLNSANDFASGDEYMNTSNADVSSILYDFKLEEVIEDFDQYRIDEIETFLRNKVYGQLKYDDGSYVTSVDSIGKGFYFIPITDTTGHVQFPTDTTIKINYTGYRLDGQAFDTTVERTAIDNYIWNSDNSYKPKTITWAASFGELTMESSSLIAGFSKTVWQMNKGRGIGIFWSTLGYGSSASGSRIPAYAPLMFEVEFVEEEE